MSNGTRKKKVDFKKLLVTEEESNIHFRKKATKSSNLPQFSSNKKEKTQKNGQKQKENKEKMQEKNNPKKIKTKNIKDKEQISVYEFTNTLKFYKDELNFLNKKRNSDFNIDKITNLQKNNGNKIIGANNLENKYENKNKKNDNNMTNNSSDKNINDISCNVNQNYQKIENNNNNQNSALLIDFYKLYLHLFESNRLDNSKPYKFVDYLITGDNLLFNIKKDKTKIEEIKRGISIKSKNNNFLINDHLLNKFTYEYLKCDFSHSFMKKFIEKINIFLMNNSQIQKKKQGGVDKLNLNLNAEKKDKFTYSNFLADKLKENSNKSILSFTNDTEYFKSLIYVSNKFSKYIGKKEMPEKILLESLEKNKLILEKFKQEGEERTLAIKEEQDYLRDLLKNRRIKKYMNKKFKIFSDENIKNNKIFSILNMNVFNKILEIFLKNKNDDDIDKLFKIFQEEIFLSYNIKPEKNDLKNFIMEFRFLLEIEIAKKRLNNDNVRNINEISIMKKIYENVNRYLILNREKNPEEENNSNKKGRMRNKLKMKNKKDLSFLESENDSIISDIKTNEIFNNDMTIESEEKSPIQNKFLNIDNKSEANLNTNNQNSKSKIVPFKIPYPRNNSNQNINANNNSNNNKNNVQNSKLSLFEINTIDNSNNDSTHSFITTKSIFNNSNKNEENNNKTNAYFETEKHDKMKSRIKRRKRDNNIRKELNDIDDNDNNLFNNCITFNALNSSDIKEKGVTNIGKYLLNRLSLGQDIFKLVIEKPKLKKNKEKETKDDKNTDINSPIEEKDNIDLKEKSKEIYKKECETRENSSQNEKNEKIEMSPNPPVLNENSSADKTNNINQVVTTEYIFSKYKSKNKISKNNNPNIDNQRNIDTITFNNSNNSENGNDTVKEINRNDIVHSPNIGIKITQKKDKEIIFNTNNKILFNTNKSNKIKNKEMKKNLNIQIDRQSVEIKGGNVILNDKRDNNNNEDILKINDYFSISSI